MLHSDKKQVVGGRPPRYAAAQASKWWHDIHDITNHHYCISMFGLPAQPTKAAWWPWPFDPESVVRVTCDASYLCANFGLPRPLCFRLRPDVRDRQTDRRQTNHLLMPPPITNISAHNVNVGLNNSFRKIFNCCWRESKDFDVFLQNTPWYIHCSSASYSVL